MNCCEYDSWSHIHNISLRMGPISQIVFPWQDSGSQCNVTLAYKAHSLVTKKMKGCESGLCLANYLIQNYQTGPKMVDNKKRSSFFCLSINENKKALGHRYLESFWRRPVQSSPESWHPGVKGINFFLCTDAQGK